MTVKQPDYKTYTEQHEKMIYKRLIPDFELEDVFEEIWGATIHEHEFDPIEASEDRLIMRTLEEADEEYISVQNIFKGQVHLSVIPVSNL